MQVQQDCKVPVFKHVQKEYKVPVLIQFKNKIMEYPNCITSFINQITK